MGYYSPPGNLFILTRKIENPFHAVLKSQIKFVDTCFRISSVRPRLIKLDAFHADPETDTTEVSTLNQNLPREIIHGFSMAWE